MFLILYIKPYRRENAVLYARKWAFSQNPLFGDYGKLGGKELAYASDLDLVFIYDDERPEATMIYSRLVRRMM